MSDTVYVLGAGLNQAIKIKHAVKRMSTKTPCILHVSPPMGRNFFREALSMQSRRFTETPYKETLGPLYAYIQEFWKKNISDLENSDFDLEECFSLMDLQLKEAEGNNDIEKWRELMNLEYLLRNFLVEVLFEFGDDIQGYLEYPSDPEEIEHLVNCEAFKRFGSILYNEKPIIITFNYDDFIERAIEYASGIKQSDHATTSKFEDAVLDQELGYSYWNWNRALGYGIKFDEVMLYDRSKGTKQKHFEGSKFYAHPENMLYPWYLLKLHGSSNWFQFLPYTPNAYLKSIDGWRMAGPGKFVLVEYDKSLRSEAGMGLLWYTKKKSFVYYYYLAWIHMP